jgi:outer membrane protein
MKKAVVVIAGAAFCCSLVNAQVSLPAAPAPRVVPALQAASAAAGKGMPGQIPPQTSAGNGPPLPQLTLPEAERLAIRNNPHVSVGRLLALAQHQVSREAGSAELPTLNAAITGVDAEEASRISAGGLTTSRLLTHAGAGASFTQLIYDFGRTRNLVLSRKLEEKASNANALATTEEIVLATDSAFYDALTAQAVLQVAEQTVNERQVTDNQVRVMTQNKLKSTVDLAFADVDLSQAKLLQLDAQNNADASMAALDAVLGLDHNVRYDLVQDATAPPPPPSSAGQLVQLALAQRPDLQALSYDTQSAQKYARAERDQLLPSISAAGTVGTAPVRSDQYYVTNWWGAVGGNVSIPVFNGLLYSSEAREAKYREQAAAENDRALRDQIVRDVRTAWLQTNTAWQRLAVTAQLLKEANLALELAQTRYKLGLSSIVELSQAQLQQTSAQIENTNARYQYRLSLSTLNYETGVAP